MNTAETSELPASNTGAELADQSNEQLLQRLAHSVESRRRHRNKQKVVYAGYYLVCGAGGILLAAAPLYHLIPPSLSVGIQLPFFLLVVVFMAYITYSNRRFYRKTAQQRDGVIRELARREEASAIGPLLELMDMRMSGSSKNWGASRMVFIEALGLLLACLTPESFAELTDAQIHQLSPLLLLPEPELRSSISAMLCRSGDARALRSLRKYESMYRVQRWQKFNPAMPLMLAWLRKSKMPTLDKEAIEEVTRCCKEIEPRVEAEQRMAQLLRASDAGTEQPANQLLRGAMPTTATEPVEQLLHPVIISPVNEEEAQRVEVETASLAARNAPSSTFQTQTQTAEAKEVKLMRG